MSDKPVSPLRQRMIELCAARSRHSRFSQSTMLTVTDDTWPLRGGASISGNTCIRA
jgi:hypothetical protein